MADKYLNVEGLRKLKVYIDDNDDANSFNLIKYGVTTYNQAKDILINKKDRPTFFIDNIGKTHEVITYAISDNNINFQYPVGFALYNISCYGSYVDSNDTWHSVSSSWEFFRYEVEPLVTDGKWKYKIHNSDLQDNRTFDAWYYGAGETFDIKYASGTMYRSDPKQYTLPSALQNGTVVYFNGQVFHASFPVWGGVSTIQPPKIQAISGANRGSVSLNVNLHVVGTL